MTPRSPYRLTPCFMIWALVGCTAQDGRQTYGSLSDVEIYRLAIETENSEVVRSALFALSEHGEGYHTLINYVRRHYSEYSGVTATEVLKGYATRPNFSEDMAALLNDIDFRKVGGQQSLKHLWKIRYILLTQILPLNPSTYSELYLQSLSSYLTNTDDRIGFDNTDLSDNLILLDKNKLLSKEDKIKTAVLLVKIFQNAFHNDEHTEAMRCLKTITGIESGAYSPSEEKSKTKARYMEWINSQMP